LLRERAEAFQHLLDAEREPLIESPTDAITVKPKASPTPKDDPGRFLPDRVPPGAKDVINNKVPGLNYAPNPVPTVPPKNLFGNINDGSSGVKPSPTPPVVPTPSPGPRVVLPSLPPRPPAPRVTLPPLPPRPTPSPQVSPTFRSSPPTATQRPPGR
jgi:hypothetical protein